MRSLVIFLLIVAPLVLVSQINIEGYVYETGNRGFIDKATVSISNEAQTEYYGQAITDDAGTYRLAVSRPGTYTITIEKLPNYEYTETVEVASDNGNTVFLKHEIRRSPGYSFEITLAEKDPAPEVPRDALKGALVEVYNNTKKREELVIDQLETPDFKVNLVKGNHYTILIRKAGFLSKRMEAFVDVEGCILCFEGIGTVTPGVSDNLTDANSFGVLLANVEMDRYYSGKVIGLNDIYYDFGKSNITDKAAAELVKVADFLNDNPQLKIELGSHTDSRGKASANLSLSEKRARAAVDYLVKKQGISSARIAAKGYGETQLVNDCKDGMDCDEDQHRLNRRTELKILDVVDQGMNRSLRQMKADELMEEILADIEQTGQVRIPADGDMEAAFSEAEQSATNTTSRKFQDYNGSTSATKVKKVVVEKVEEPSSEVEEVVEEVIDSEVAGATIPQGSIVSDSEEAATEAPALPTIANDSERFSASYTGYKVVVIYSRFELPKEHIIYDTYPDVDIYTTADGNKLYMLGGYDSKNEAEQAMLRNYKKDYPQSYIIGFERGNRVY